MKNNQMIAGRFFRWAQARAKYRWIADCISEGRTVYLSTAYHSTRITAKHLHLLSATPRGLLLQRGKKRVDYSYSHISAS